MSYILLLESLSGAEFVFEERIEEGVFLIGRDPENTLVIDDPAISRRHGYFLRSGSQWVFCDLGSTNGSWLNSQRLQPNQFYLVRPGDLLQLSRYQMQIGAEGEYSTRERSILIFNGEHFENEYSFLDENTRLAGRRRNGRWQLDQLSPEEEDLAIARSGLYIQLEVKPGEMPVLLNGQAVVGARKLSDRDNASVGMQSIIINDPLNVAEQPLQADSEQQVFHPEPTFAGEPDLETPHSYVKQWSAESKQEIDERQREKWEQKLRDRTEGSGKKFIFSSSIEDHNTTLSMPQERFHRASGFETNVSSRFASEMDETEEDYDTGPGPLRLLWGALFLLVGIGCLIYLVI